MCPRISRTLAVAALFGLVLPAVAADNDPAAAALAAKGLKHVGSYWILPAEQELQDRLKSLTPKKRALDQALKLRTAYDREIDQERALLQQAIVERQQLAMRGLQTSNANELAAIANRVDVLTGKINVMILYVRDTNTSEQISQKVGSAGDAFYKEVHELRQLVDKTKTRYDELGSDTEVGEALGKISDASGHTPKLGPRKVFETSVAELERYEAAIHSEEIKLRSDHGVFWITATINGGTRAELIFDTGASIVSFPADLAKRAGVAPTDADPVIQMQVANGNSVEGRLVFLKEVRVGDFAINNVEAVVMPAEAGEAPALLGGSFLRHFTIDMNQATQTLKLTQVSSPTAPPAKDKSAP